jgi:hypothetical protein
MSTLLTLSTCLLHGASENFWQITPCLLPSQAQEMPGDLNLPVGVCKGNQSSWVLSSSFCKSVFQNLPFFLFWIYGSCM